MLFVQSATRDEGSGTLTGWRISRSYTENKAAFDAMPTASVRIATDENPGVFSSERNPVLMAVMRSDADWCMGRTSVFGRERAAMSGAQSRIREHDAAIMGRGMWTFI